MRVRPSPVAAGFFRFRLRSLLFVMAALAVGFGFIGNVAIHARRQAAIAAKIKEVQGSYDYIAPDDVIWYPEPTLYVSCRKLFGENACRNIRCVSFGTGRDATDGLQAIQRLPKLAAIRLGSAETTDENLKLLSACPSVHWIQLNVAEATLTASGISELRRLPKLRYLELRGVGVDDELLRGVESLTQLEEINIASTKITAAGFASLNKLPQLHILSVDQCAIDDIALRNLNCQQITRLRLSRLPDFTAEDMAALGAMTNLKRLSINDCAIGDDGLRCLPEMPELSWIYLPNTGVTDACIPELLRQPKLTEFHLQRTQITVEGLKDLCKTPKVKVLSTDIAVPSQDRNQLYNRVKGRCIFENQP
jgi:hypothetical protein